jgi:glycine oxidase
LLHSVIRSIAQLLQHRPMPVAHPDILLIGAGVIGLTTALNLAERGVSVTLLDRQSTGREASWAGAGILPPGNLAIAATPEARLRSYSHSLWNQLSTDLSERTGIDNGFHICGALEVFSGEPQSELTEHLARWNDEGIRTQPLSRAEAERHIPDLGAQDAQFAFLPDCAQVRNPRHLLALKTACRLSGVEIVEHVEDLSIEHADSSVTHVRTPHHVFRFSQLCITAGAWSSSLLSTLGITIPIQPVRGQIVQLQLPVQPFQCIIEKGRQYLVPRQDGLVLIGSTEEHVGFLKENTLEGISELRTFATSLVPSLSQAEVVRTWAGLRPGSPDELPLIGAVPGFANLFLGAGHFRSGLQMSPATATILADLMTGRTPAIPLDGLTVDRFRVPGPAL